MHTPSPPDLHHPGFGRRCGIPKVYRLRWVLEFEGRPRRQGMWDIASPVGERSTDGLMDGLRWAVIEGEHLVGHAVTRILEVGGAAFEGFEAVQGVLVPGGGLSRAGGQVPGLPGAIYQGVGVSLGLAVQVSGQGRYVVYCDGRVVLQKKTGERAEILPQL